MFSRKWKIKDQARFLTHVGLCLERGYSLAAAIRLQSYQQPRFIYERINCILSDLSHGNPIADVLYTHGFSRDVCSYLYFSEKRGDLAEGFKESGRLLNFRDKQKRSIEQLLRYPLLLIWIFGVMFYITINHLLPSFERIYASMNLPQPFIIKALLTFSGHFYFILLIVMIIVLTLSVLFFLLNKYLTPTTKVHLLIRIPLISSFTKMSLTYLFSLHFGGLLRIGMSVNETLKMVATQDYQPFFRDEAVALERKLTHGSALEELIAKRPFYLKELVAVINNGNAYGRLGWMLSDYSHLILKKMEGKIKRAMSYIQPIFFLLFGGLIILLFLAMMLPIFNMMNGL